MPPGATHKKRKSESDISARGSKRTRGSRGGVLGRPRKSETHADRTKVEPSDIETMDVEEPTTQPTRQPGTAASSLTRRGSRKSATSALESSIPWDPADDVLFNGGPHKQAAQKGADGVSDPAKTVAPSSFDQKPKSAVKHTVNGASSTTPAKSSTARTKVQQKKRVSFSPETQGQSDNVEFFARITTAAGIQEVPLLREDLTHEVDLVEAYAKWQTEGQAPVTFEVFKNIAMFARPS